MNGLLNLFRGFSGHPSHPPLTDASIGAYTAGTLIVVAGWLGFFEEFPMARAGFLTIGVGLLFAIPTVVTGFADYFSISRKTGLRRLANFHWMVMVGATAGFVIAAFLLERSFDASEISTAAALATAGAFLLLVVGGYAGGAIVFEYGMRVTDKTEEKPALEALKPKWPPFKDS